ncbi:hypothetical protein O6H91_01G066800 [Diphasiastrum complanatum]|uniref:Uncharacterized protein n=1 Tax=Diphasiastrum complanatum TaxID=34168 RepID=A0ACC2ES05_DIPCM|nr:hypothetical protein O6H91_01G066800 [Diphasiastrum complanatum]
MASAASIVTQTQQHHHQHQHGNCNACCVRRYDSFFDIPWRVYCKKGCKQDKWEDCKEVCRELCYKDPVIEGKSFQWTARLDRSPGVPSHSRKCAKACVRGCGFKFHSMTAMLEASMLEEPIASKA